MKAAIFPGAAKFPVASDIVPYSGQQHDYGNMVVVRHDDGMVTIYAHHNPIV